ncbi:sporulation protein YpeB [Paraliobacillus ryukyuensis]|uniref:Spore germination protein n=1 Tax=Paraliobacillus ryukyuensis TaxID=200904 RepID=A0A366EHN3_9BACI|nr:germination protein YpeB [Paraliobacillus ryukyuensis]RBP01516.1 spore germination protein [Paraliobacillus ryukyuensis]
MFRWIFITVLSVVIFATGFWGYQEHQEKNAILVQAENNYQRAFHDLTYQIDLLHDKIGTTLAMNTKEKLSPQLIDIWRLTSEAHTDVGQLPLSLLPFNKTEEFLANIGDFTYRTAVRNLEEEPLSDKELETLKELHKSAGEIEDELRKVQHVVLEENLRWMDVQLALVNNDEQQDNTIIDGFKTVEEVSKGYSESMLSTNATGISNENHEYQFIKGKEVGKSEVKKKLRDFFELPKDLKITVTESGKGANLPTYSGAFQLDEEHGYIDVSKQGGHILSFMLNREIKEQKISLNEASQKAAKFLKDNGLADMELAQSSQYDHVGVFQFLYKDNDVRVYPDKVQLKVALDNGEILGFVGNDFYRNHHDRMIEAPKLSLEEAKEKVNPSVKIQDQHLAIIESDIMEETLAYAFLGTMDDETYRIFIDANSGAELQVEKMQSAEAKFQMD